MEPMDHIILFTKYPIPGYAKTRMIGLLGQEGAAMLSKELSEHILRVLRTSSKARSARGEKTLIRLLYAGNCSLDSVTEWLGTLDDEVVEPQSDGDLGKRLSTSFIDSFERMNARKVLVVGSDIPGISEDIIQEAFQSLDEVDVVVGPSFDGGYYLMGMRQPTVQVFQNIPWSCDRTLEVTKHRMLEAGLSCKELGPLADVDEPADFEEWRKVSGRNKDYYLCRSVA